MKGIKIFTSLAALIFAMSLSMHVFAQLPKLDASALDDVKEAASDKLKIDDGASTINWKGEKVTGEHVGTIQIASGELITAGGSLNGGTINIDMKSIKCTDLKDPGTNAKLVGHLKSEDFFSVEKFPTASFEITNVKPLSLKKAEVTGKMTIKGITNEESFEVITSLEGGKLNANGTMKIDRSKYNVKYGSKSFFEDLGDKMIYDEFTLDFKIVTQ